MDLCEWLRPVAQRELKSGSAKISPLLPLPLSRLLLALLRLTNAKSSKPERDSFNSAVDSALDNFWPIVGGFIWSAVVTAFVAIILYFRAPQSEWLRTVLKYGLAYLGGFLTFAFLLVLLALLGVRRRKSKLRKQSRLQEHVSTEKGPLDYRAELKPTIKNFQRITRRIGKVLGRVASRAGKIAKWIAFLDRISPALSRRSANKGAAVL